MSRRLSLNMGSVGNQGPNQTGNAPQPK